MRRGNEKNLFLECANDEGERCDLKRSFDAKPPTYVELRERL